MKKNVIQKKSYEFALKIIGLYRFLVMTAKEYVLAKQILRSGTSIGANVEEAIGGQSRKDFIARLTIAYREARETSYWLRLLRDSSFLESAKANSLLNDCNELLNILGSIQKTVKNNS